MNSQAMAATPPIINTSDLAAKIAELRTQAMARGESRTRELIVAEAMTWLGTPYHHSAGIKGAGCDCGHLIARVYQAVKLLPPDRDMNPQPYAQHWFLHRDEELFLLAVEAHTRRVEVPKPGDVALYQFGRTVSHAAIIVDDDLLIHAHAQTRRVDTMERRALVERLHGYYTYF